MVSTSSEFQRAVENREPQIALLLFDNCIFSNEDIRVDRGIEFHDFFNLQDDLCVGQALSNTIAFTLYNDDRLLNDFAFGQFTATIGVRTRTSTYVQHGSATLQIDGSEWVGSKTAPFLRKNGGAVSQPSFPVKALAAYNGIVYAIGENGQYKSYTTSGSSSSATLNRFMRNKLSKWDNVGYYYNDSARTLIKWQSGTKELYEFCPLGVFEAERPDVPDKIEIDFLCYDLMQKFEKSWEDKPGSWFDYKIPLSYFYDMVWSATGLPGYRKGALPANAIYIEEYPDEFRNTLTLRNALEWIAEAVGCNAKFNRSGVLQFIWVGTVARSYDESNYKAFDPCWFETQRVNKLVTRSSYNGYDHEIYTGGDGAEYLVQDNPFLPVYRAYNACIEDGPWEPGYNWASNPIEKFDQDWYWDRERVVQEFDMILNPPEPEPEPEPEDSTEPEA